MFLAASIDVQPFTTPAGSAAPTGWSYDATEGKGRRRIPTPSSLSEDRILFPAKRAKVTANSRDIARNFSLVAWAIRRHLDYVSSFRFHIRSGNKKLDSQVERIITNWSLPKNCDAARRHSLAALIRLTELGAIREGDSGLLKLADARIQGIEGDRVRNPPGELDSSTRWTHGVRTDLAGAAIAYAIHRREKNGFAFERAVSAGNFLLHGYFDRIDQVRGISPITAALNQFRDIYDNFDLALAKAKVHQLFALSIFRNAADSAGTITETSTDEEEGCGGTGYDVNFGKGPILLDLDPGDRAEFLESKHPSTEFQSFTQLVSMIALKALDIPYSFLDEAHTNFFGSRGAWLHYERSTQTKRDNLAAILQELTAWRLGIAFIDGELQLPAGFAFGDLFWEWVPVGMPWWDPVKEISGENMAVSSGFDTPQHICKKRGTGDWYDNIDQIKEAMDYAATLGVPLSFAPQPQPIEVTNADA